MAEAVFAQEYPTKPIRFVVPYPPGGSSDIMARILGQKFTESWGQSVIIDNRPGASAIIGTDLVAKAPPDGYTLLWAGSGPFAVNSSLFTKLQYDPIKDFTHVIWVVKLPMLLLAHPSLPASSVKELITLMKSKREGLPYGSIGVGSPSHLAMELFKGMAKVDQLTHVPYSGSGTAHTALLGGQGALVMFDSVLSSISHVKAGKEKAIALSTAGQRLSALPDVPTVAESGLPGFDASTWGGVAVPAGVPQGIVKKLNGEIAKILKMPDVQAKLAAQGALPVGGTPQEFTAFIKSETAKWGKVIRDANVKPE
ncbi:MAG: tripartite tricarboxylate transporter substrate binding protein [Deltaproteobacteria bacterium]|nr:tripartite tricarboxylate transporter substrate binding protein [Deltaproteobacteria bacterium]